jgi:hypothetical protein
MLFLSSSISALLHPVASRGRWPDHLADLWIQRDSCLVVDSRSCVCCLAVGHMDDRWQATTFLFFDRVGSGEHGQDPRPTCHKVSVSSLMTDRFISSKCILVWCSPRSRYGGCSSLFPALPWWLRRAMMDNVSVRHRFLLGWNCNFTFFEVLYASLLDTHVYVLW